MPSLGQTYKYIERRRAPSCAAAAAAARSAGECSERLDALPPLAGIEQSAKSANSLATAASGEVLGDEFFVVRRGAERLAHGSRNKPLHRRRGSRDSDCGSASNAETLVKLLRSLLAGRQGRGFTERRRCTRGAGRGTRLRGNRRAVIAIGTVSIDCYSMNGLRCRRGKLQRRGARLDGAVRRRGTLNGRWRDLHQRR